MATRARRKTNKDRYSKITGKVYLSESQDAGLRELSASTGAPMQFYLRLGVDLVLAKMGKAP